MNDRTCKTVSEMDLPFVRVSGRGIFKTLNPAVETTIILALDFSAKYVILLKKIFLILLDL